MKCCDPLFLVLPGNGVKVARLRWICWFFHFLDIVHLNQTQYLHVYSYITKTPSSKAWLVEELELEELELEEEGLGRGGGLKAVEQILRFRIQI